MSYIIQAVKLPEKAEFKLITDDKTPRVIYKHKGKYLSKKIVYPDINYKARFVIQYEAGLPTYRSQIYNESVMQQAINLKYSQCEREKVDVTNLIFVVILEK